MISRFNYSYSLPQAWRALRTWQRRAKGTGQVYASLFGSAAVYETASARTGLCSALRALNLKPGAGVGLQPYTCSSVMAAIEAAGYQPVFIDINEQLMLDKDDLSRKKPLLDALIVTHLFGLPADINALKQEVGSLPVIEDCAHAFMSIYEGRRLGTFFDLAVFSFGYGKFPVHGSGGLVVVNNPRYNSSVAQLLAGLRPPGLGAELAFLGRRLLFSLLHNPRLAGWLHAWRSRYLPGRNQAVEPYVEARRGPYRSAVVGSESLEELAQQQRRQQEHLKVMMRGVTLAGTWLPADKGNGFAGVLLTGKRNQLYDYLTAAGIGAGKHFEHALHWATAFGYAPGSCPVFEHLAGQVLTIPAYHTLTEKDLIYINQTLRAYCRDFFTLPACQGQIAA